MDECQKAKECLQIGVEYSTTITGLMDGHNLTCTLTREELKEICMTHLDKLVEPSIMDNMKGAKEHLK